MAKQTQKQWSLADMVDMSGKTVLVTGGNTGMGYISCKAFLEKNAKVYMAARDSQKSRDAISRLKQETGKVITLIPLDLTDLHNVRKAGETFLSHENKLDVLLNNAGVMATPLDQLTKDGYDAQFGINVLGHFHLTSILLPALLAAPAPRVVNVASWGHRFAPPGGVQFDTLKGPKKLSLIARLPGMSINERYKYYGQSKLGNILHANELARRYGDRGLVAISLHPGFVDTELTRNHNGLIQWMTGSVYTPVETGALTQIFAASAPEAKELSGKYLLPVAQIGTPTAYANDKALATRMWEWCEQELKNF